MVFRNFNEIVNLVKKFPVRKKCGVVAADEHSIEAAIEAEKAGLADPVFIGNHSEISRILHKLGSEQPYQIVESINPDDAAEKAVTLAREGKVDFLLKGHIDTSVLLKAVVNKDKGLGTGKLMTHFVFNEIPTYHKLLVTTDGGMVTYPDVDTKQKIIENTVEVLHKLGYENPKIACLAAVEKLNPKMLETVDAEELKRRNIEGIITGCIVEGPISFDLAYDRNTALLKDYHSQVAGDADVLLVPNITAGNILGKSLVYAAGGRMAGFIVGAKCPIILTSRSSTADEKFLSIALSALFDA